MKKLNHIVDAFNTPIVYLIIGTLAMLGYLQGGLVDAAISVFAPVLTGVALMYLWPNSPRTKK